METDYWMGLDVLASLMKYGSYEALIKMTDANGEYEARYSTFHVGNESTNFLLSVGGFNGTTGLFNSFELHNKLFSTPDRRHDTRAAHLEACASLYKSGFWFGGCGPANINGPCPNQPEYDISQPTRPIAMRWQPPTYGSVSLLKTSELKIRPAK